MISFFLFGIIKMLLALLTIISTIITLCLTYSSIVLSQIGTNDMNIDIFTLCIFCYYEMPIKRGLLFGGNYKVSPSPRQIDDIMVRVARILVLVNVLTLLFSIYVVLFIGYYYGSIILISQIIISHVVCLITGFLY